MGRRDRGILLALLVAGAMGCRKTAPVVPGASSEDPAADADPAPPMDARESAQWDAAAHGEAEESMRLVDLLGCSGLRERSAQADLRATAIRAMQYCPDLSEFSWLATVADQGGDADAKAALESIDAIAARPRRATDPEYADELHAGCASLLAIAHDAARPKERRFLAVRALRMLTDRGCAPP